MQPTPHRTKERTMTTTVTVQRRDGSVETHTFDTPNEARSFCHEEVMWESTAKVICEELCIDAKGTYA